MDKIEEVKKIREQLDYCYYEGKASVAKDYHWPKEIIINYALDKICQLFLEEPKPGFRLGKARIKFRNCYAISEKSDPSRLLTDEIRNYAAKWFDKGREYGNAPITKDILTELEKGGEELYAKTSSIKDALCKQFIQATEESCQARIEALIEEILSLFWIEYDNKNVGLLVTGRKAFDRISKLKATHYKGGGNERQK